MTQAKLYAKFTDPRGIHVEFTVGGPDTSFDQFEVDFESVNGLIQRYELTGYNPHAAAAPVALPVSASVVKGAESRNPAASEPVEAEEQDELGPVPPRCEKCRKSDLWDNREMKSTGERSAKAPDFKCKNKKCEAAMWYTDEGQLGKWKKS